jgi:hypothetical protein
VKPEKLGAKLVLSVSTLPLRIGWAVVLGGCLAAESSACGSKSDLVIGQSVTNDAPQGGTSGETDGAPGPDASSAGAMPDSGDAAPVCAPDDVAPVGSLLHRYSFSGTGATATDSAAGADGQIELGGSLDGNGSLVLDGVTGYVNLPNHLISVLTDVTFVTWCTYLGGAGYERIFDFGVGVGEDDTSGAGVSYVAVAPYGGASSLLMLARQDAMHGEITIPSNTAIDDNKEHQVALVFAGSSQAELYLDGALLGRTPVPFPLSDVNDVNDWIGRSQWNNDHTFNGTVDEFRIYGAALTPCAIAALNAAGPNAP